MDGSEADDDPTDLWGDAAGKRLMVAQATGVLVAQFRINVDDAFDKIAALASDTSRPIVDVAREIVENNGV